MAAEEDLARRCADAMLASDQASRNPGMEVVEVGPGRALLRMTAREEMTNGRGIGHGGYTFALGDSALAVACNTYTRRTVAATAEVELPAAGQARDQREAEAVELAR